MKAVSQLFDVSFEFVLAWTELDGMGETYRYEKMTSITRTNLLSVVGRKGEMKAGMKKTTERTAWIRLLVLLYTRGSWSRVEEPGMRLHTMTSW